MSNALVWGEPLNSGEASIN